MSHMTLLMITKSAFHLDIKKYSSENLSLQLLCNVLVIEPAPALIALDEATIAFIQRYRLLLEAGCWKYQNCIFWFPNLPF